MSHVKNVDSSALNNYSKQEWTDFLAEQAYRGHKINKLAGKSDMCSFDKTTHQLKFTSKKGSETVVNFPEILETHTWSLARLCHIIKMACSNSYAEEFNARISKLAELISNTQEGQPQPLPLPQPQDETHSKSEPSPIIDPLVEDFLEKPKQYQAPINDQMTIDEWLEKTKKYEKPINDQMTIDEWLEKTKKYEKPFNPDASGD